MATSSRERILAFLMKRRTATGPQIAEHLGISRQAVNKHLRTLIAEGTVTKSGSTRSAAYAHSRSGRPAAEPETVSREYPLEALAEDRVLSSLEDRLQLSRKLAPAALAIARYSFTKILNNAIDHSRSPRCAVRMEVDSYDFRFRVRDFGIGIFESIRTKFNLADEEVALERLLKGETTTMAERHSGEGIFFISKAADSLQISSHRTSLSFDNRKHDTVVRDRRMLAGTDVSFTISRRSRRDLNAVFTEYAPEEYDLQFQKTRVLVRLHLREYISRSEARRLLSGLEKFKEVVLDPQSVRLIGQGFADEVFRVFPAQHPGMKVSSEHASPSVAAMIRHVTREQDG